MPVDHEVFNEVSNAQWLWYFYNNLKDSEDSFKQNRDFVEYLASFSEPESVRKVRDMRDNTSRAKDDNLSATVEKMFGGKVKFKDDADLALHQLPVQKLTQVIAPATTDNPLLKSNFWKDLE